MTPSDRELLVLEHLPLVRKWARLLATGRPVERGELESIGTLGLIEASHRYDPANANGASFSTFAAYRIRGAMLDQMRSESPLSRADLNRTKAADAPYIPPPVTFDSAFIDAHPVAVDGEWADPFMARRLRVAIGRLPRRLAHIMVLLYWRGLTGAEIAPQLGVNESRIAQLKARALKQLRAELEDCAS